MTFIMNTTDTPTYIASGKVYRIHFEAENSIGISSNQLYETIVGITDPPSPPSSLTNILSKSSSTSIALQWTDPPLSNLPIEGYMLYIDDGLGGDFSLLYDGSQNP